MATNDLSRSAYYPQKRFSGVRLQQGRVLTDGDFNEQERINHEDKRLTSKDVIGTVGSPDAGFSIVNVNNSDGVDFTIYAGTFYLGGLRISLAEDQTFKLQYDWLQKPVFNAPGIQRRDMVYLEVWQQNVSAVEDEELYEKALGGPDTATRRRTMFRVKLVKNVGTNNCPEAWNRVVNHMESNVGGKMMNNHELLSDAELTVGYEENGDGEDLCSPSVLAGYLGAENQTIRVQLKDKNHFTWGFDNCAPLYRVTLVDAASNRKIIKFITEPKDQAHWPQAGQVVEIISWSAVLENGEKLAEELSPGSFFRISDSYDPDSGEITLNGALSTTFGEEWKKRTDANKLRTSRFGSDIEESEYFFLRVWNRGAGDSSDTIIAIENKAMKLGTTGLNITIDGTHRLPGDHWIIAARPHTPDQVIPWQLEVGRTPEGYQRFYAPLAIIHWNAPGDAEPVVYDCRNLFPPLTEMIRFFHVSGDGQEALPGRPVHSPIQVGVSNGQRPVEGAWVMFKVVGGDGRLKKVGPEPCSKFINGDQKTVRVKTGQDGVASCCWKLDSNTFSQQVEVVVLEINGKILVDDAGIPLLTPIRFNANHSVAGRVAYDPKDCEKLKNVETVQKAIDQLCQLVGRVDPGIHIKAVFKSKTKKPLYNDKPVTVSELAKGLRIECDQKIASATITEPTCFVTLDIPAKPFNVNKLAGFQPLILDADLKTDKTAILWNPRTGSKEFMSELFKLLRERKLMVDHVLGHLTLRGNFICAKEKSALYLDGNVFGRPRLDKTIGLDLEKGSGDGKRGGDFTMWFWLIEKEEVVKPLQIIGVEFLSGTNIVDETKIPPELPVKFKAGEKVNLVKTIFSREVHTDGLDPDKPQSLGVARIPTFGDPIQLSGKISLKKNIVTFHTKKPIVEKGQYVLGALGDKTLDRPAIKAKDDKTRLDGDLDGKPGGNFELPFKVV